MQPLVEESLSRQAVRLLEPLIGIQGSHGGRLLELVDVLLEGPSVALMDRSSSPCIQVNQYGDPVTRQARIMTLPVVSALEVDAHPILRSLLPEPVLKELRASILACRADLD